MGFHGFQHPVHRIVVFSLFRAEPAIDRQGAGEVCGIIGIFGTYIQQYKITILHNMVIIIIMQDAGIRT